MHCVDLYTRPLYPYLKLQYTMKLLDTQVSGLALMSCRALSASRAMRLSEGVELYEALLRLSFDMGHHLHVWRDT